MNKEIAEDILSIELEDTDIGDVTIRQYLFKLLASLWELGEGFSGKRPFGNSSWEFDIYKGLVKEGFIKGSLDDDGYLDDCDTKAGYKLIRELIEYLSSSE